jgi:hypothetical protein
MDSTNKQSKNYISDSELSKIGVQRDLWESWYEVMDNLYVVGQHLYPEKITNIENDLHINETQISGSFIDGDHIEVSVSKNGTRYMSIRYNQNIPTVVSAVYAVVQDHAGPCQDFSPEFFEGIEESFN